MNSVDSVEYSTLIKEGDSFYEQREYSKALKLYSQAADMSANRPDAFFGIVRILTDKGQLGEASEIVEQSTGKLLSADRTRLYETVAKEYVEIGDLVNAEKYYLLANRVDGGDNSVKVGLAEVYIKSGKLDKAGSYLNIDRDSDHYALSAILKAYLKLDNVGAAKSEISNLSSSTVPEDLKDQFDSLLSSLNSTDADKLYNSALLAREYINYGFPYLAVQILEPHKEEMVEYADGLYFLGRAYYDYGQFGSAIQTLKDATSFGFYTGEIYTLLAKAYYINDQQSDAFDHFEKAITFAQANEREKILKEYIDLLISQEQYAKALSLVDDVKDDSYWTNMRYVQIYYAQKSYEKMKYHLGEIDTSKLTDDEKKDLFKWSVTYEIEEGTSEVAQETLEQLKALDIYNPHYYLLLGKLMLSENNQTEGKAALERAIEYDLGGSATEEAKRVLARID